MPKLSEAASSRHLKAAFDHHLSQTREHVSRLESIFNELGEKASGETCEAMKGLIKEGELFVKAEGSPEVKDAGLIGFCSTRRTLRNGWVWHRAGFGAAAWSSPDRGHPAEDAG